MAIECDHCGSEIDDDVPNTDEEEAPYWKRAVSVGEDREDIEYEYFCSDGCALSAAVSRVGESFNLNDAFDHLDIGVRDPGSVYEVVTVRHGTHTVQVAPSLDTPADISVHLFDHLSMFVQGDHKDDPEVAIEGDEFPTTLELYDPENSMDVRWGNGRHD